MASSSGSHIMNRRRIHCPVVDEAINPPSTWQTACGWPYGLAKFFRVPTDAAEGRRCKKCFPREGDGSESGQETGESSNSSSSSASS